MLYSPTGSGKTEMSFVMVVGALAKGRRVVFIANRKELVRQASRCLTRAGIAHGILQAENTRSLDAKVLVCSIDTVHRRGLPDDVGFIKAGIEGHEAARVLATAAHRAAGGGVQPVAGKPERSDEDKLNALRRVWLESKPIQRGDEAETYLTGRGLRLYDLPESIRVYPGFRYQDGENVGTYAAMLATVTGPDGRAVSLHRTYLQNGQKAPVAAPKKLMQSGLPLSGAAIRLTPVSQVLGIAEGIETALAASELFEVPAWSCVSAQGIESLEPPAGVEHVIVFADNDTNFAGQKAAYAAAHRLKLKGFEVEVVVPPAVGDWLNELNRRSVNT